MKHPVQSLVHLKDLEQDTENQISVTQAINYTAAAWRQATELTIVKCFHQCSCQQERQQRS